MMNMNGILRKNEKGATAVFVAVILTTLLGFAALGVDVNYLYGVRNELHNAADAGALAGASKLFDEESGELTPGAAIAEATRIATANRTGNQAVVVGTVETGHWSFTNREFTANSTTTQAEWQERSSSDLDLDPGFINAVKVVTHRSDTPSFFAKILGFDDFFVSADAVAYIGCPGTFYAGDFNLPFAVCLDTITGSDGNYIINMGRVINSGGDSSTSNTGAWTNFTQDSQEDDDCSLPVSRDYSDNYDVEEEHCGLGNNSELQSGQGIGLKEGMSTTLKDYIYPCWQAKTEKKRQWNLTLPVITCNGHFTNCDEPGGETNLVGAVNVNIVWMTEINQEAQFDAVTDVAKNEVSLEKRYQDAPREMTPIDDKDPLWTCDAATSGFECWKDFVDTFNIQNVNGPPVSNYDYNDLYQDRALYYLTDGTVHKPTGGSGGTCTGVMAGIPKLVK